jgi:hypothetical protein
MTHLSRLSAAALLAAGLAAQAPAQAGLPPLFPATQATDASGALIAMGPGVGISCTVFGAPPVATPKTDAAADPAKPKLASSVNPRALPRRNACQSVPQTKL